MAVISKHDEVVRQVRLARRSQFGVTAVKVELEGVLGRRDTTTTLVACDNGCDRYGMSTCDNCTGTGCNRCDFSGNSPCKKCFLKRNLWSSNIYCQQWLLRELHQYGLSTLKRSTNMYEVKRPLVFARFYTDPSVDSEFTFTLDIKKDENIFLLPKIVEAWNKLGQAIGRGCSITNAGMHMALLSSPNASYPYHDTQNIDRTRFANFEKSMRALMPALFFLGSTNSHSRGMHFRLPQVSDEKFSAVHWYGGALEFRVFETCYDDPEAILDNFVVMRNCIRFWSEKYRSPKLEKIAESLKFGNDRNDRIDRLYTTVKHLDVLMAGLVKIKPAYKTLTELKKERDFGVNKKVIGKQLDKAKADAAVAYSEYASRYEWREEIGKLQVRADILQNYRNPVGEVKEEALARADREVADYIERSSRDKQSLVRYVGEEVRKFTERASGQYNLRVS